VAFGISLNNSSPSSISGLSQLSAIESLIGLQSLMLVVSSLDMPGFEFPDMAHFNAPQLSGTKLTMPRQATGLVRGLNFYAQFTTSNDRGLGALLKYLGIKADGSIGITLGVSLPNPSTNSKLFLSVNEKINNVTTIAGELGVMLQSSQAAVFLLATVNTRLQGQPVQFTVSAMVVANGVFISGTMVGSLTFGGVTLSNVALVIGIDFEGIPSLGFAATLTVASFQSSLAIFFDSTDPARSMLAGAVSELSLKDVLDTFAGKVIPSAVDDVLSKIELVGTSSFTMSVDLATALDNRQLDKISAAFAQNHVTLPAQSSQILLVRGKAGSSWFITDMNTMLHYELVKTKDGIRVSLEPQFYFIPQTTAIGTLRFDQGTFINTGLEILTFHAMGKVLVKPSQGISVDASMSRIVIGTENLFSVESADGKSGPRVSAATFSQPAITDPALQAPHLLLDGQLNLLGIKRQVYISISSKGFGLDISGPLAPGCTYTISGSFTGLTDLDAGGSLQIGLGTIDLETLGKINIKTGTHGAMKAGVHGSSMFANFTGEVEWAGHKFKLPVINLDVKTATLQQLPQQVFDQVVSALKNFLQDATQWAALVRQGFIQGVSDVGKVLNSVYHKGAQEAAQTLRMAGYSASQSVGYLKSAYGASINQASQWLKGAGYTVDQVGDALKSAWTVSATTMASALRGAGYTVDQAGSFVKDAYHLGSDDLKKALEGAGYATNQVKGFFKSLGGEFADAFKDVGDAINPSNWFK
jgi:hypothetical protein